MESRSPRTNGERAQTLGLTVTKYTIPKQEAC